MKGRNIAFLAVLLISIIFFVKAYRQEKAYFTLKQTIISEFGDKNPLEWSEAVSGVKTRIDTHKNVMALTFDACGSKGDGYDSVLIDYLNANKIPATIFASARWIRKNPSAFKKISRNTLFEIGNHGFMHKPCSVSGKQIYGIQGTKSAAEVVDEIEKNSIVIESVTKKRPRYYRSGTAYYDEVGVKIAERLGYEVIGFNVLGDKGATYTKEQVKEALLSAPKGSIVICHINHPEGETAEGVIAAVSELKRKGVIFVKLSDFNLK